MYIYNHRICSPYLRAERLLTTSRTRVDQCAPLQRPPRRWSGALVSGSLELQELPCRDCRWRLTGNTRGGPGLQVMGAVGLPSAVDLAGAAEAEAFLADLAYRPATVVILELEHGRHAGDTDGLGR